MRQKESNTFRKVKQTKKKVLNLRALKFGSSNVSSYHLQFYYIQKCFEHVWTVKQGWVWAYTWACTHFPSPSKYRYTDVKVDHIMQMHMCPQAPVHAWGMDRNWLHVIILPAASPAWVLGAEGAWHQSMLQPSTWTESRRLGAQLMKTSFPLPSSSFPAKSTWTPALEFCMQYSGAKPLLHLKLWIQLKTKQEKGKSLGQQPPLCSAFVRCLVQQTPAPWLDLLSS